MSEGKIGVTVSMANPFDDDGMYYNNEETSDSNMMIQNTTYDYSNRNDNSYNISNDQQTYNETSINQTNNKKRPFLDKTKNGFNNVLKFSSDKIGKPLINFSKKINTKVTDFLHI